jgi:predicted lysophospholipase L1 biosynthesis ABC-type transport system permease subunit
VDQISQLPGVTGVVPVLGINDVPIAGPGGESAAFGWVLDDAAGGTATPIGPKYLIAGRFDLGTSSDPRVVLDRDTSIAIGAQVGDRLAIRVAGRDISLEVSGVAGSAARYRGPSIAFARFLVDPLLPADSPFKDAPYTELLITGSVDTETVQRALLGRKTIIYSKGEQLAILEGQIEVSQPVITVVSVAAAIALTGFGLLVALFATERRRTYLRLLPALGASVRQVVTSFLVIEALPTALAAGIGAFLALSLIVNTYFAQISVNLSLAAALLGSSIVAGSSIAAHMLMLAVRRASLRP